MPSSPLLFRYCPLCATPYSPSDIKDFTYSCRHCGYIYHENLRTATGALIIKNNRILLVKRAQPPRQHTWDIPGGFTLPHEHPETSLLREIQEELGVDSQIIKLFGVYAPNPYIYLGKTNYTCDLFYLVSVISTHFKPADDAAAYHWFSFQQLPPSQSLAFPTTRQVLTDLTTQFSS